MNIIMKVQIKYVSEEKSDFNHPFFFSFKNEEVIKGQTPNHLHIEDFSRKL